MTPVVEAMQLKNRVKEAKILRVSEQLDFLNNLREQRFYYGDTESQRSHEKEMDELGWLLIYSGHQALVERYVPESPGGILVPQSIFLRVGEAE